MQPIRKKLKNAKPAQKKKTILLSSLLFCRVTFSILYRYNFFYTSSNKYKSSNYEILMTNSNDVTSWFKNRTTI